MNVVSGRARRAELLAAARRVVEREGFAGATVGAITREAGASQGLLNYHFASRDEVLAEVFEQLARSDLAELRAIEERAGDAPARLAAWIASNDPTDGESWRLWVDAWGTSLRADAVTRTLQQYRHGWVGTLRRTLAQGVAEGAWTCGDTAATAAAITAAVDGIGLHVAIHPDVSPQIAQGWIHELVELHLGVALPEGDGDAALAREPDAAVDVTLRATDFDGAGRLRHSVQLVLLEEARTRALQGLEVEVRGLELEYRRSIVATDEPLAATCTIERSGVGLIRTTDRLVVAGDEVVTVAHTTAVAV
jgi:AcrR family transcriptional regulator